MSQANTTKDRISYIYGPVHSWRSGTSLGIDPIGEISTCSFNCAYCQLGQIQNITTEIQNYVPCKDVLDDFQYFIDTFTELSTLDVITFAGSGEPTLAANLGEIIDGINEIQKQKLDMLGKRVPISILTNATLFNEDTAIANALKADLISLKLDASNNQNLKSINQAASEVSLESIITGIKKFKAEIQKHEKQGKKVPKLMLQIMLMPKFIEDEAYISRLCKLIQEIAVSKIQINTPTRPKPATKEYLLETRGNHYYPQANNKTVNEVKQPNIENLDFIELPVISREQAFNIEAKFKEHLEKSFSDLEIINVYKKH